MCKYNLYSEFGVCWLIYRICRLRIVKCRSFSLSLCVSLSLPCLPPSLSLTLFYISVNKVQRDSVDIYTIRQAIIDGRYISASWIGFNELCAVKFAHTSYSPSNYTTFVDRLEIVRVCVRVCSPDAKQVRACVDAHAHVATTRMQARMQASGSIRQAYFAVVPRCGWW